MTHFEQSADPYKVVKPDVARALYGAIGVTDLGETLDRV
jgi:hypothetical protein